MSERVRAALARAQARQAAERANYERGLENFIAQRFNPPEWQDTQGREDELLNLHMEYDLRRDARRGANLITEPAGAILGDRNEYYERANARMDARTRRETVRDIATARANMGTPAAVELLDQYRTAGHLTQRTERQAVDAIVQPRRATRRRPRAELTPPPPDPDEPDEEERYNPTPRREAFLEDFIPPPAPLPEDAYEQDVPGTPDHIAFPQRVLAMQDEVAALAAPIPPYVNQVALRDADGDIIQNTPGWRELVERYGGEFRLPTQVTLFDPIQTVPTFPRAVVRWFHGRRVYNDDGSVESIDTTSDEEEDDDDNYSFYGDGGAMNDELIAIADNPPREEFYNDPDDSDFEEQLAFIADNPHLFD